MIDAGQAKSDADFSPCGGQMIGSPLSREDLIHAAGALSRLLGTREPLESLEADEVVEILAKLEVPELETFLSTPDRLRESWDLQKDEFLGPNPTLSLEESVYKAWTTDRSHPLAGSVGRSWGDPAAHMMEVLDVFGLSPDPEDNMPPDHLAVLLEFLSFLIENRPIRETATFCSDHLDWLPEIRARATVLEIEGIIHGLVRAAEKLIERITVSE